MAYKIYLDPGHGGYDNGAQYNGRKEKDEALDLALAVGKLLSEEGYDVQYTRTTDVYQSPTEKAQIANRNDADLFVSFHRNASATPNTYQGVQTLLYDDSGMKAYMARNINEELEKIGFQNLGVSVRPNLAVLRRTNMPALLLEVGFIDSDNDNQIYDQNFNEIAQAIAEGITETLKEFQPRTGYSVQTGLYRNYANALYELDRLEKMGFDGKIVPWKEFFAVRIGVLDTLEDARRLEQDLRRMGNDTLIVKETEMPTSASGDLSVQ